MATIDRLIITGGAGFIGANLVHFIREQSPNSEIMVVDKLTYAGNLKYLEGPLGSEKVRFVQADIADSRAMQEAFERFEPTGVLHLAAESHVDRSISGPRPFIETNIVGTFELLECARLHWVERGREGRFLHVSTDEVYGSLGNDGAFTEETRYDPSSPYSASKAASDHLVQAYHRTFGVDVVLTNCSNNFGPYQYPEKLIPVMITKIRDGEPLPVYGDGSNVRDWLYVEDHCSALWRVFESGEAGRAYNIGSRNEWSNLHLVRTLCDVVDDALGRPRTSQSLISFVTDRPGHDHRYAIDPTRLETELGWRAAHDFTGSLKLTVAWYLENLARIWG